LENKLDQFVLQVSNLTKVYGFEYKFVGKTIGKRVVGATDVSFDVKKGEIFGFLGPNGAGKSTTMRSILDYLKIQSGVISVLGLDHHQNALSIRRRIGYLPGDLGLYDNFSGAELLKYAGALRPVNTKFLQELKSTFKVNLNQKIKSLSTGNRQQVGLLLALSPKPEFLILDEPTNGLDPLIASNFHKILRNLKKEGITIFLCSHDLAEVQAVCDRVGIIKNGKIILVESVNELRNKSIQHVKINFSKSVTSIEKDLQKLKSVISIEKNNDAVNLKIKGDPNELLRWLSKQKVRRLAIENASLEDIFLQYYK
jgi:ABC-2 type transport system ATP-binding protein